MGYSGGKTSSGGIQISDTNQVSTPTYQWYAGNTMNALAPALKQQALNAAGRSGSYMGMNPQQMQAWQTALNQAQMMNPYAKTAGQYLAPVLGGGWGQYIDPQSMESQRADLARALPLEQSEFIKQAQKDLAGTPYATGANAAALGSGYGQLKMNQALQEAQLEGSIGQRVESAKQFYGGQLPGLAGEYAQMTDPMKWGSMVTQFAGMPQDVELQRQAAWAPIASGQVGESMGAAAMGYASPVSTKTVGVGGQYGREESAGSSGSFCCYIVCAAGTDGKMLDYVQRFKDAHIHVGSEIALGYKRLATWLVPPMLKHPWFKKLVKFIMVTPIEKVAEACYENKPFQGYSLTPIALFWLGVYKTIGKLYGLADWQPYWNLGKLFK